MNRRWGIFLHKLGMWLAALALFGAILLNAAALQWRLDAQRNLRSLAPETSALQTELAEAYGNARASTANLKRTLMFGGIWIVGGMVAYAIGVTARNATGGRRRRRRR